MIVNIQGDLNRSYAQTLCLIYFPGAKFSEQEERTPETPVVTFTVNEEADEARVSVLMENGGVSVCAERSAPWAARPTRQRVIRMAAGAALFAAGAEMFGTKPSWGILTGVRPAKVAIPLIASVGRMQTEKVLCEEYLVQPQKAALVTEVATCEMDFFARYGEDTGSLYVSMPFCPTRCAYCSFVSYSTKRLLSLIPQYLERLCSDLERMAAVIRQSGKRLIAIYIGGGTPSILSPEQLGILLRKIEQCFDTKTLLEYSFEAGRPDTITEEKLRICAAHGVTRISINPQTLNDSVLAAIGRKHTVQEFYEAFEMARKVGISQINTDLIAGLPGDHYESFSRSLDAVLALAPENLTVHTFCVKKSADIVTSGAEIYSLLGGDTGRCVDESQLRAKENGLHPYYLYRQKNAIGNLENVGFAKPGTEGLYNMFIMEEVHNIYGVGAGAVTKLVNRREDQVDRVFMPKYPYEYLAMQDTEGAIEGIFSQIAGTNEKNLEG